MDEARYKILFNGMVVMETPEAVVKANMARLFKCDLARVEPLFNGQTAVLKRNLTEQEANRYMRVLREAGAIVHKERDQVSPAKPVAPPVPLTLVEEPDLVKPVAAPTASAATSALAERSTDPFGNPNPLGGAPIPAQAQRSATYTPTRPINPYKSPTQELVELRANRHGGYCELNFISLEGRLGRVRYLVWPIGMAVLLIPVTLVCAFLVTKFPPLAMLGVVVVGIMMIAFQFTLTFRRLHDINMSAWWMLLLLVPLLSTLLALFLLLKSGDEEDNDYGPPPPPNSMGVNLVAYGMLLVIVFSIGVSLFL
jgi:uncharacterized membrane protein YhaH (DUF805 family)